MHSGTLLGPVTSLPSATTSDPLGVHSLQPNNSTQPKEELKTQFITREGTYRVMTLAEYTRPNRAPMTQAAAPTTGGAIGSTGSTPVRVSFLSLPSCSNNDVSTPILINSSHENGYGEEDRGVPDENENDPSAYADRICFNIGRELYVYLYRGTECAADLSKPIDKRVYKGTSPTCHQFNAETATPNSCSLIIGFSAGQIQLIDPFQKDYTVSRLYNEERIIDKTAVTCLKWIPGQPTHFLVSHSSGCMYVYNEELQCPQTPPSYQVSKQGDRFTVYTCKAKASKNPIFKWHIGESGAITQFAFSHDGQMLGVVGHDGFLRVFNYHQMELLCVMKSYFGGLLTLSWSPDNKLIVTGGEDDLLTVYSVAEKRVICRGQGHKSWISQVAFDPYTSNIDEDSFLPGQASPSELEDDGCLSSSIPRPAPVGQQSFSRLSFASFGTSIGGQPGTQPIHPMGLFYRIGSVGHDTQLCLWDITDDMLKSNVSTQRHRNSTVIPPSMANDSQIGKLETLSEQGASVAPPKEKKKNRLHRRGLSIAAKLTGSGGDRNREANAQAAKAHALEEARLLGTKLCPRIEEVPIIEPLICKKISHERLTVLEFRKDCIVTACQEGFICTWARPGKVQGSIALMKREGNSPLNSSNPPPSIGSTTIPQNETSPIPNGYGIGTQQPYYGSAYWKG